MYTINVYNMIFKKSVYDFLSILLFSIYTIYFTLVF